MKKDKEITAKKERKLELDKSYGKGFTVKELIKLLKKCPQDLPVKYTTGGSLGHSSVTYVNDSGPNGQDFVLVGELSW